ncbi:MAG: beta-ketoacyl synthase chain length factor [Campylobacterales bacterium]|nr:beta-ketoacyl synthase chain length factor [Campylobacterales bacterium]
MIINLEILEASYIYDKEEVLNLNTKILVPKMIERRRLTRASKLIIELISKINFNNERIIYGTGYGELLYTSKILKSILNNESVSPTDFQNSVYNTAVSYSSILSSNTSEILTISSGDKTSEKVLKVGAVKSLDLDNIILIASETMNIESINEINKCNSNLECAVLLKIRFTQKEANFVFKDFEGMKDIPKSLIDMFKIAMSFNEKNNVIGIKI